jgi:hypothetical protein
MTTILIAQLCFHQQKDCHPKWCTNNFQYWQMDAKMLVAIKPMEVVVLYWHSTILLKKIKIMKEVSRGWDKRTKGICKSFNISHMKTYERPMRKCVCWLWWHKLLQKPMWSSFGMGFWTVSFTVECNMLCYSNPHNSP